MKIRDVIRLIEKAESDFSAYAPDLPGCVAPGRTREEVETMMFEAVRLHLAGPAEDRAPIPESNAVAEMIAVPA